MAKRGATTTYIRFYEQAAGLSVVQTMKERFAYGLNPQKLGRDAQDYIHALLLCVNKILRCPIPNIRHNEVL